MGFMRIGASFTSKNSYFPANKSSTEEPSGIRELKLQRYRILGFSGGPGQIILFSIDVSKCAFCSVAQPTMKRQAKAKVDVEAKVKMKVKKEKGEVKVKVEESKACLIRFILTLICP